MFCIYLEKKKQTCNSHNRSRQLHVVDSMEARQYSEADIDEIGLPMPKVVCPPLSGTIFFYITRSLNTA